MGWPACAWAMYATGTHRRSEPGQRFFNSYPLDAVAQAAATAAIEDRQWFEAASQSVREVREVMSAGLEAMGSEVLLSQLHFDLHTPGKHIFGALRAVTFL